MIISARRKINVNILDNGRLVNSRWCSDSWSGGDRPFELSWWNLTKVLVGVGYHWVSASRNWLGRFLSGFAEATTTSI